ncbi:MAG: dimethylsulfonioproprionate lyase family protein [Candidatus Puniceispirillaceae bacterium]
MDGLDHLCNTEIDLWHRAAAGSNDHKNSLWQFAPPPDDLIRQTVLRHPAAAATHLAAWDYGLDPRTATLHHAIIAALDPVQWQFAYREDELDEGVFDHYGFFELIGPTGHFTSKQLNAYIGYWGPELFYPAHYHEAEELYFVISGEATFTADGRPPVRLGPTQQTYHASWQPHAMTTGSSPILTLILWRGSGLDGAPILCP